jgi:hypothetical protein
VKSRPPTSARTSPVRASSTMTTPCRYGEPLPSAGAAAPQAGRGGASGRTRPLDPADLGDQRVAGRALEGRVEAGVHAQAAHVRVLAEALAQLPAHGGHVVRRGSRRLQRRREGERLGPGLPPPPP